MRSLRIRLRRLFAPQPKPENASKSLGIVRTVFEDATVNYFEPVKANEVHTMQQCLNKFGRKHPVQFKQLTLASQNTFKS